MYAMQELTLKQLATQKVAELIAGSTNPSYHVKAFSYIE